MANEIKVANLATEPTLIRLVKNSDSNVTFSTVQPMNCINNATELSFNLAASTTRYSNIVLGHAGSANIINPAKYITVGDRFSVQNNQLTGNITLSEFDANYTTLFLGLFVKITPADLRYLLALRSGDVKSVTLGVGSRTYTFTVDQALLTNKQYFNDANYYLPLFLGTLTDLGQYVGQTTKVSPIATVYNFNVLLNPTINIVTPLTGIKITNPSLQLTVGKTTNLITQYTPASSTVGSVSYVSSNPSVISFSDSTIPVMYAVSLGSAKVTVSMTDKLGNVVTTSQTFSTVYGA